jgi:NADH-quinone oxidoreductase subunit C
MTADTPLAQAIQQRFADSVLGTHAYRGQQTVVIMREAIQPVAQFLRDDPAWQFDFLMDLTAVDYLRFGRSLSSAPMLRTPSPLPYYMTSKPSTEKWERLASNDTHRFEVVYHFFSSVFHHRVRVKAPLTAADPVIDSLTDLWHTANWFEREVWDMFGIRFTGHPNLRRILMYEQFQGHPLRKDYPVNKRQPLIGPAT